MPQGNDMSEIYPSGCAGGAIRPEGGHAAALRAVDWLYLAAAPTFAIMALLTGALGSQPDVLCSAAGHTSPLSGMIPMYLLMSAFHSPPWLKLISSRRNRARRA
jgi:predicted lipase